MGKSFLLRVGRWGNAAGPGHLIFRVLLSGTASSAMFGLAGASLGGALVGTGAIPFVAGACFGFIFGAVGFYRDAIAQSRLMLDRYPRLLQLHLDANFPTSNFHRWHARQLRSETFAESWILQSMLVTSWLTARPAIEQIWDEREKSLIEELCSEHPVKDMDHDAR